MAVLLYNRVIVEIFVYNFEFIFLNLILALIPVVFGYLLLKARKKSLRFLYGFIWFVFLPNTAYILLDIIHLFEQWGKVDLLFKLILIAQYGVFLLAGILTFIYSTYCFEKLLIGKSKNRSKRTQKTRKIETSTALFSLNFMVGFGVVLGFVLRTNSWHVVTQPFRVFEDTKMLLYTPNLIFASLIFGLIANILYFYFSKPILNWGRSIKI